jgi:hypothetical protein
MRHIKICNCPTIGTSRAPIGKEVYRSTEWLLAGIDDMAGVLTGIPT